MRCVATRRDERVPSIVEKPRPTPGDGEALVRIRRVGVDGTDHEVIEGSHGGYPAGEDHLVLGHEAVGVVEDANGTDLAEGTLVAPTIRRDPSEPGEEPNEYFEQGRPDMAPPGQYLERGIEGAHGFMAEYITTPAEYLVEVPSSLEPYGFLSEPASIVAKARELADQARPWAGIDPGSALVLGNGSLGLLALAMLDADYDRLYCLGRRDRPDPTIDIIEDLGATYVDSRETPVGDVPTVHEPVDLVVEATGHARHAFDALDALAPGGVAALLGIPAGEWSFEIPGARLHREAVLEQKALVGSVCSHVQHFETGIDALTRLPESFLAALVTDVVDLDSVETAFRTGNNVIKTAVAFDAV